MDALMKALRKAVTSKQTKMMIRIPSQSTGALISKEEQLEIVELARENDMWAL